MASYRQHSNGKWEYRIRYFDPRTRQYKEKCRRGFPSKTAAKREAQQQEYNIDVSYQSLPLSQWLQTYVTTYRENIVSPSSVISDNNSIRIINAYFQQTLLDEVTPEMYQAFVNDQQKRGYAPNSIKSTHSTFRKAMDRAVTNGHLSANPCLNAQLPSLTNHQEEIKYLPAFVIRPFLSFIQDWNLDTYYFFRVLLDTGLRRGEAAALTWDDIDMENQTIHVAKSYDMQRRRLGPTKTRRKRTIMFTQALKKDLFELEHQQNLRKMKYGERYDRTSNVVLANELGERHTVKRMDYVMKAACKFVKVEPLPLHALRHTHAVLQLEAGISMKALQERLGHASMSTTANIYSHVTQKIEQDSLSKYEARMKDIF